MDVVPEGKDVLSSSLVINNDKLILQYMHDVKSVLLVHDLTTGAYLHKINIPVGTVAGTSGRRVDNELFVQFMSFLTPGTIYRYDFSINDEETRLSVFRQAKVNNFESDMFETTQVFYPSKDGTKIPMFITHKKVKPPCP